LLGGIRDPETPGDREVVGCEFGRRGIHGGRRVWENLVFSGLERSRSTTQGALDGCSEIAAEAATDQATSWPQNDAGTWNHAAEERPSGPAKD